MNVDFVDQPAANESQLKRPKIIDLNDGILLSPSASTPSAPSSNSAQRKPTTKPSNTNKNKTTESSIDTATFVKWFVISLVAIMIISLVVFICHKIYSTRLNNMGALLETSRKEEAVLHSKLKAAEQDKIMYARKVNELNEELGKQASPYSTTLPMTKDSYDAPDPDKTREKPQLLKDKEALRAFVNSKRTTVQDELDEQAAVEREANDELDNETKQELRQQTHIEDLDGDGNDSNNDNEKVEEIMEIIQS